MSLVSISELRYSYPGAERPALDGVSLTVEPGEFVVLAGLSGSGKSTLLRAISGLVPHFYGGSFGGHVTVAGRDTREHRPGALADIVGTLFQDPETQVVMGTARAELAFAPENRGLSSSEVARAVEETALALALEGLLDRPVEELSGGELQRVALGATLSVRPSLVCLDEPTSQLDPVAGDELVALLRRLNEDGEMTVLLAEHRLERCLAAADRVLALAEGRLVFDGAPQEFLAWALAAAPALVTPGARLLHGLGLTPLPGVKHARAALREAGLGLSHADPDVADAAPDPARPGTPATPPRPGTPATQPQPRRAQTHAPALRARGLWHELADGPAILRGVELELRAGERVALMGRNGAGKSTLLKHAAGLMRPTRGSITAAGRVALLLQNPRDYLVHETVAQEAPAAALAAVALSGHGARHPRELSAGEQQRLALAVVLGAGEEAEPAAVVCLDEPTRGMDRAAKQTLCELLRALDAAVIVATHDCEFAAAFAQRTVLLAEGRVIADGPTREILSGGVYFATETARILGPGSGALLPEQALELLGARRRVRAAAADGAPRRPQAGAPESVNAPENANAPERAGAR
ncbi:MAG TPA: ATP-binding cassette domain-containing protein [Solirubrobacteraceae bacterium]|nr:ATP-binding cassette domain-containing protein [Solirubrobacteraceae bacterium]